MLEDLIIINSTEVTRANDIDGSLADPSAWIKWNTCLRQIRITFGALTAAEAILLSKKGVDVFHGQEAYGFFLAVVCGLKSPLVGETEVMGQFKELVDRFQSQPSAFGHEGPFRYHAFRFFHSVLTDAKVVRDSALKDLGHRTYGGLIKRYIDHSTSLSLLGAGKLATELLPWVKHVPRVTLHCRREVQGEALRNLFPSIEVAGLDAKLSETVVIAAPLTCEEILDLLENQPQVKCVIDLRDTSASDALPIDVIPLHYLFDEIKKAEAGTHVKLTKALSMITDLAEKKFRLAEIRPFGWEDLCG